MKSSKKGLFTSFIHSKKQKKKTTRSVITLLRNIVDEVSWLRQNAVF